MRPLKPSTGSAECTPKYLRSEIGCRSSDTTQSRVSLSGISGLRSSKPNKWRCQASEAAVREAATDPATLNSLDSNNGLLQAAEPAQQEAFEPPHINADRTGRLVFAPEDFKLEPGAYSQIDRLSPASPEDVFRCNSCTEAACQGVSGCAKMQWRYSSAGYLRKILNAKVYDVAEETPLQVSPRLSEQHKNTILLKREDMQPVFSFKLRGAYNKMASLSQEQRDIGVITSSAGNHAQGVALSAKTLGCKAIICMPVLAPDIKVQAVKRLGGTVKLVGETYTETQLFAQEEAKRQGMVFIPPYDDPYVIAGQGTAGAEILRQLTSQQKENLEAIFVAIGGGGLAAGIASYTKQLLPHVKVFGVEPAGANCMAISLAHGRRATLSKVDAFADGVAVKSVGAESFRLCRELLDGVLLVDNQAISGAIEAVFNDTRSILEPAGAAAVAGAAQYIERNKLQGKTVVAVTSGANMNFDRIRLVSDLAAVGSRQEAIFVTTIPERLGSFQHFMDVALADTKIQITEFKYRYSAEENAHILWGANVNSEDTAAQLTQRLNAKGLSTRDASSIEAVQVHLRHLVGGRARSFMGSLPHEKMIQVYFPERPGALRAFLSEIVPTWNLTLFHYRKSGNTSTSILVGIQVPPETEKAFKAAQNALGDEFDFTELDDKARQMFDMFIS